MARTASFGSRSGERAPYSPLSFRNLIGNLNDCPLRWRGGRSLAVGASGNTWRNRGMNLILIGAQGSGKGTQSQMLSEELGLQPCASGDLLREEIARGTPLGRDAKAYYDRGDLVP